MAKYCTKCGTSLGDSYEFCVKCGMNQSKTNAQMRNELYRDNRSDVEVHKNQQNIKQVLIILLIIGAVFIGLVMTTILIVGMAASDPVSDLKNSTLPSYSRDITIEEAFEDFFINPEWSTYESGEDDIVVFKGVIYSDEGDKIVVTMEMLAIEGYVEWKEIVLYNADEGNTTRLTNSERESLLNAIYEDGNFSWYW